MSLIQHQLTLDVRDLADLARENFDIAQNELTPSDEKANAVAVLKAFGSALISFDHPAFFPDTEETYAAFIEEGDIEMSFIYGEDIAVKLESLGSKIGFTLVAESHIENYVERVAIDFDWVSNEIPYFVSNAIDWLQVANTLKVNNDGGELELDGETYWIGL